MRACPVCGARYDGDLRLCPLDRAPLGPVVDPLAGRRVGAYRLVEKIGQGGLSAVYRAHHDALGRDAAVKILSPSAAQSPALRERFLREGRAAHRVRHPCVVEVHDVGVEGDLVFLVMELIEGETLAAEIARGPLASARAAAITLQIADALALAHELGVLHRDIKPANVMVLGVGGPRVKLVDFGLAKVRGELGLTATGALCGSPAYLAPEQIDGEAGPAGDLYALGCVLFEMLTGAPPFVGPAAAVLDRHAREPAPAPSIRAPGVPPWLDVIVVRLLEKDPARRHPSAAALAADLSRAAGLPHLDPALLDALQDLATKIDALSAARHGPGGEALEARYRVVVEAARALLPRLG